MWRDWTGLTIIGYTFALHFAFGAQRQRNCNSRRQSDVHRAHAASNPHFNKITALVLIGQVRHIALSPPPHTGQPMLHPRLPLVRAASPHLNHGACRTPKLCRAVVNSAEASMAKRVLVPIATGSEEMEAVITIDVLRRAGAEVVVASVEPSRQVSCSRGVQIVADKLIEECASEDFDLVALPGGMPGAERLRDSQPLFDLLKRHVNAGNLHAAICATPAVALESRGYLKGKKATSHPGFVEKLADSSEAERRVVVDGVLTTSRGPGTAFEFALSLVQQLYGDDKMREVAKPMVMYDGWEDSVAQADVAGVP